MGTSTAYSGPSGRTPLVPSWLDDDGSSDTPIAPSSNGAVTNDQPPTDDSVPLIQPHQPPIPEAADSHRFSLARNNFTRFASSGGRDNANRGRAVSKYISKSVGGTHQATQRMGASRGAGARLLGFLVDAQARGVRGALQTLDLESLAGRPLTEIFIGLADYVCPGAGSVDEGIAREAYIETIVELANEGFTDLDTFTPDQIHMIFELYVTHAIESRICNDIGTKAVTMPANIQDAYQVEQKLRDFIRGGVSDALTRARTKTPNLTPKHIQSFVDALYESAFTILQALGDAEADQ